jgi:hypothetical protein
MQKNPFQREVLNKTFRQYFYYLNQLEFWLFLKNFD